MNKHLAIFVLLFLSIGIFADENPFINYSETVYPLLDEVVLFHQDEDSRYRVLIFRGGYEHVSANIVFQKFSIEQNGQDRYYHLISAITIDEINNIYNFGIETIIKTKSESESENGFTIILNAVHSYSYDNVIIEIHLSEDLEYEIISDIQ